MKGYDIECPACQDGIEEVDILVPCWYSARECIEGMLPESRPTPVWDAKTYQANCNGCGGNWEIENVDWEAKKDAVTDIKADKIVASIIAAVRELTEFKVNACLVYLPKEAAELLPMDSVLGMHIRKSEGKPRVESEPAYGRFIEFDLEY